MMKAEIRIASIAVLVMGLSVAGCNKALEGATPADPETTADFKAAPAPRAPAMEQGLDLEKKMDSPAGAKDEMDEKSKEKGGPGGGSDKPAKTWKRSSATANTSRLMVGDVEHLPLAGMQVQARVDGFRARVLIDYYFFNDRDQQLEGTFQLRLSEGGSPWFLAFGQSTWRADGQPAKAPSYAGLEVVRRRGLEPARIVEDRRETWSEPKVARMVPAERAARAYGDTVRRQVDPALMEWAGAGVFRAPRACRWPARIPRRAPTWRPV